MVLVAGCGRAENSLLLIDELPDVASITFEGNRRVDDGTLKGLMTLREGTWWNPFKDHKYRKGQLKTDLSAVLTYYMRHGYLKAQILDEQVRRSGDEVHITIRVSEGEQFWAKEVVIQGASALNPNKLREEFALKPGKPMDPFKLQDDRRLILRSLAELGYWQAQVRASVQFFGNQALVFYVLEEGDPVTTRKVTIEGSDDVGEDLVWRDVSVKEGKRLRLDDLKKSQIRLLQSGYFADAQWDTTGLDSLKDEVSVEFRLRERRLHWFETGIGVSSQELIRITGEWGTRNFLGTGMRFAVTSQTDLDFTDRIPTLLDEQRNEILLNRTHLLGTRWEGQPSLTFRYDRDVQKNVGNPDDPSGPLIDAAYEQSIYGAGVSVRRRFGDLRNQVIFSLTNRWVWNNASQAARLSDPQLYRDSYTTRLLSGFVERDSRNDFFSPTGGSYQSGLVQFAGGALGGNNGFFKQTAGTINFLPVPGFPAVLATRLQLGYIIAGNDSTVAGRPIDSRVELIPNEDRFLLGGANTVRGYIQNELDGSPGTGDVGTGQKGGLAQFLFCTELRFPLLWRFSGVCFLDAGNVWQDRAFLKWNRFVPHQNRREVTPYDVRYAYGVGLRFNTLLGPVRVDYARKWNLPETYELGKDRWYVALGHAF